MNQSHCGLQLVLRSLLLITRNQKKHITARGATRTLLRGGGGGLKNDIFEVLLRHN